MNNNRAKRENFEGAGFEAFWDRGLGKCVEARGRNSKRSTMEVDKGRRDFNTEFREDTDMRRSGGRSNMGSSYQRRW